MPTCSLRVRWSTSYTTPLPKVGTLKSYTSVWLILSSVALKKWGEAWGPIRNVTRLCRTGMVNTSPCFV